MIEFQERGHPHCHLLVFLHWPSRENITPSFLDDVISAELPPIMSPVWQLVITQMMHGPCGSLNPNAPCMHDGKCEKDFPKDFCNATIVEDIEGYPKYWHQSPQDGGVQFMKKRKDNGQNSNNNPPEHCQPEKTKWVVDVLRLQMKL